MMQAEEYLDRVKKIDAMIENKLRDRAKWVEVAQSLGGDSDGDRVQSSRNLHRGADAIGNYIDLEREIEALKAERAEIIKTIERLPVTEYDVVYKFYIQGYSIKEIAFEHRKSYEWVKLKKNNGLTLLQAMLDETMAQTSMERQNNIF